MVFMASRAKKHPIDETRYPSSVFSGFSTYRRSSPRSLLREDIFVTGIFSDSPFLEGLIDLIEHIECLPDLFIRYGVLLIDIS